MHKFTMNTRQVPWFTTAAENYLLSGNLDDICDHNARIANYFGKGNVMKYSYFYVHNKLCTLI